jgi:azurin
MTILRLIGAALLLTAGTAAYADPCKVSIESNDMMQFNTRELAVPANCAEVEVTLHHAGKLGATVMGHDWVLAKESDVSGLVNAGLAAGAVICRKKTRASSLRPRWSAGVRARR